MALRVLIKPFTTHKIAAKSLEEFHDWCILETERKWGIEGPGGFYGKLFELGRNLLSVRDHMGPFHEHRFLIMRTLDPGNMTRAV